MAGGPWKGKSKESLEAACEEAAEQAEDGEYPVKFSVYVHHNEEGEEGPNPIRDYIAVIGGGDGG